MERMSTPVDDFEIGAVFMAETNFLDLPFSFTTYARLTDEQGQRIGTVTLKAYSLKELGAAFEKFHPGHAMHPEYDVKERALFLMKGESRCLRWSADRDYKSQCVDILTSAGRKTGRFVLEDVNGQTEEYTAHAAF